jgi:DNA invertase Pin-like site-specific DNA recombinase
LVLDGYIRVSQVAGRKGERFISPVVQREQIEGWVSARGNAYLGEVFEELDESGARDDRPLLMQALDRVEQGESEGLVVAKLDRFGRLVVEGLRAIKRIEQAGGTFVSVQEGIDNRTPTGKFVLQVLFSIGELEWERVRENWDVARGRAIARGAYIGNTPLGYRRGERGRLLIVAVEAILVREIFERRANDQSCREIAEALNSAGARTRLGYRFNAGGIHKIISNPAYHGEARHGEHRNPNAHEPIVDRALWQRCQHVPRPRGKKVPALLNGLARCGSCGHMLTSCRPEGRDSRFHVYRCDNRAISCRRPAFARGDELDPLLEEFVFCHYRDAPSVSARERVEACESAVATAKKALASYRDEPSIQGSLSAWSFSEGLSARQLQLDKCLVDLARARREQDRSPLDIGKLEGEWAGLSWDERRRKIGRLIDCVIVERGPSPVLERAWLFRSGKGPVGLVDGRLTITAKSLSAEGERLRRHRRWPPVQLEGELRVFLAGRSEWPAYREFAAAGHARLFAQASRWGGPYYWGHKFGVRVPGGLVRWNLDVVRDALAPFLAGRDRWPRAREFAAAGLMPLYNAAKYHGGFQYWGEQFGVDYGKVRRADWSSGRIERELCEFIGDRGDFPTKTEFDEAGLQRLYGAATRVEGIAFWVERLGLVPSTRPHEVAARARSRSARRRRVLQHAVTPAADQPAAETPPCPPAEAGRGKQD